MKSVLLIGLSRFGRHVLMKLSEMNHDVLVIDMDEKRIDQMMPYITNAQIGDSTNESLIASLGVDNFDICFVSIASNFQSSLETTALLKDYGAKKVIAVANRDVHAKFLLRNGADEVIYAEREMAEKAAIKYCADNVFDYIKLSAKSSIYEVHVPRSWVGRAVNQLDVRQKYGINILAVSVNDEVSLIHPSYIFQGNEIVFLLGNNENLQHFLND